ncbi:MAG: hypothetical protein HYR50_03395 [Candidatus Rokubacteria bacterium]|nr:hypothetical protein [Candidatus Rokubacteria bacterium]
MRSGTAARVSRSSVSSFGAAARESARPLGDALAQHREEAEHALQHLLAPSPGGQG